LKKQVTIFPPEIISRDITGRRRRRRRREREKERKREREKEKRRKGE